MQGKLTGIEVFIVTVEAGSFARAAEKLRVTRSAVGKSIARLELRLGVLLFHRTTRSQSLTEEGFLFYEHCLRGIEHISAGEALLESGKGQVSGRLRVSMPVLFGQLYIAPVLIGLVQEHPGLTLEMSFSDTMVDLVEERFDLVIRIGSFADSGDLVARRLGEHRMVFCASPAYLRQHWEPKALEDLEQLDTVSYVRFGRMHNWRTSSENQLRGSMSKSRLLMDDMRAVLDAALAHMGVAWLPYWLVHDHLLRADLQEVLHEHSEQTFVISAVWPYVPHLPLKTRVAVDALLEKFSGQMTAIESRAT